MMVVELQRVMIYQVGETIYEVKRGDRVFSPRGVVHHFQNSGQVPARSLIVATPARMGPEYFRDVAAVLRPGGPPDLQKVFAVMRQYGLEPAPLPPAH